MHINNEPSTVGTSNSETSLSLDPTRMYTLAHDREDASHAADANTIYLGFAGVAADGANGLNKFKLLDGRVLEIGPGVNIVRYKSAGGAPTMSIAASQSVGLNSNY